MKRRCFAGLLVFVTAMVFLPLSLWAQTQAGAIKAVRVSGTVVRAAAIGTAPQPLTEGGSLIETDTVTTGPNSSVVLVFANGASIKLGADSRLAIEEFKMDPLAADIAVASLEREPNVSKTRLNLAYGEMVGNVKTLNKSGGSEFNIKTPVGAAGIRGTTFRIVMRFAASGQVTFTLSTSEGTVVFTGTVQVAGSGTTSPGGTTEEVQVADGQEVTAVATVDPATNQVTTVQVSPTQTISPAANAAIVDAVTQAIQQAQQSTTFTPAEQEQAAQQTTTPPSDTGSPNVEQQNGTPQSNTSNQPPRTQQTPLDTTTRSGSG
jgi:hypothetical protein